MEKKRVALYPIVMVVIVSLFASVIGAMVAVTYITSPLGAKTRSVLGIKEPYPEKVSHQVKLIKEEVTTQRVRLDEQSNITKIVDKIGPCVVDVADSDGGGAGVIISSDGFIATAKHVMSERKTKGQKIVTADGKSFRIEAVYPDPCNDLSIIKIRAKDLPYAAIGRIEDLELGQWVASIGHPFSWNGSVAVGVISGLNRSYDEDSGEQSLGLIQTDLACHPGNSGGPMVNMLGQVVGLINLRGPNGEDSIGFAVPADFARSALESIQKHGEIRRPIIGLSTTHLTADLTDEYGIPVSEGEFIPNEKDAITLGGPASRAGLQVGDVITEFDGIKVNHNRDLYCLEMARQVDDTISCKIIRKKHERDVVIKLGLRED